MAYIQPMAKRYRLGISTTVDYTVDIYEQLRLFSKAGFEFVSIGAQLEHSRFPEPDRFVELAEKAAGLGLAIESAHAPFGDEYDLAATGGALRQAAADKTIDFARRSAEYGIPMVIIHPHHYFSDDKEACFERAADSLAKVLLGKPDKIVVAIENLPTREGSWICDQLLQALDRRRVGFCYDSSHENMSGAPFHLLKKHYLRMITCHLSDNQGFKDQHLVPGDGNIKWDELRSYFDKSPKIHDVLLEVGTGEKLTEPVEEFVMRAAKRAKEIFG
ncbi:MAG: sugar phosphate isomerase/epimerase [Candidatus Zixiibacteriota bacterium]|nr:MAG: sugar phosphate isomerase/epimerase [candidate division Zixibacteria bacterium]